MRHPLYLIILFWLVIWAQQSYSQIDSTSNNQKTQKLTGCNLKDELGREYGLWIINDGLTEVYYKNGLRNGLFRAYYKENGGLRAFGLFLDGKKTGTWYYFNESHHLILIENSVEKNMKYKRPNIDSPMDMPDYTSYAVFYYYSGQIKEEGRILYYNDIEIDFYKTGIWKYYDEAGTLLKTEIKNE